MNKIQYGISLTIIAIASFIIMMVGALTSELLLFGVSGMIILVIGVFFLEKKKDWIVKDERTTMIEGKASHYTLLIFIITGLIGSYIIQYGGIDESLGEIMRVTILILIVIRGMFYAHLNRKYG